MSCKSYYNSCYSCKNSCCIKKGATGATGVGVTGPTGAVGATGATGAAGSIQNAFSSERFGEGLIVPIFPTDPTEIVFTQPLMTNDPAFDGTIFTAPTTAVYDFDYATLFQISITSANQTLIAETFFYVNGVLRNEFDCRDSVNNFADTAFVALISQSRHVRLQLTANAQITIRVRATPLTIGFAGNVDLLNANFSGNRLN